MWGKHVLAAILSAAVAGTAVAACASGGQSVSAGPTTPATPTALPTGTCGTAVTHSLNDSTQVLSADHGSLSCFETAARHCEAGSLAITEMGVDTGTRYVFTIAPSAAGCQVTELSQSYSANFGGSQGKVTSAQCRVAAATAAGVTLGCDGRDVLVPAQVTHL